MLDENLRASRETCEAPFAVSLASDGRAAALSRDGGHGWHYAGLEGPQPVYCPHRDATVTANPWAHGPSTTTLALEALRSASDATAARAHARGFDRRYGEELEAAARFACAHREDAELRAALSDALAHASAWRALGGGQHDPQGPLLRCASDASRADPSLRAELRDALAAIVRDGGRRSLEPYARGCRGAAERPTDEALWCLAKEALDAQP